MMSYNPIITAFQKRATFVKPSIYKHTPVSLLAGPKSAKNINAIIAYTLAAVGGKMATSARAKPKTKKIAPKNASRSVRSAGTTRRSSSGTRKKTAPRSTSQRAAARTAPRKPTPSKQSFSISPDRKVDITGIVMIVIGVLTLLSLMIGDSGVVSKWWSDALYKFTGWGAYAIPVILILTGTWFLLRKMDQFPELSGERIIGPNCDQMVFADVVTR